MGIGAPSPFVLQDEPDAPSHSAEDRLEQNMAQAVLDSDHSRGLGPEALITSTVNQVAMGVAPVVSKARLGVTADASGRVTHIEVLEASRQFDDWQRVVDKLRAALSGKQLRHALNRPVRMVFEVESKVQLPSGRTRGANVTVLGIPVGGGGDDESTQVKVLTPEVDLQMVEVLDPNSSGGESVRIPVPMVTLTILGVDGDLADIGAHARQVVHTRLLSQQVL